MARMIGGRGTTKKATERQKMHVRRGDRVRVMRGNHAGAEGTVLRVRPKLMTVSTMLVGLLPLLWADSSGADVMKRIAAPMVGGMVTATILTLVVIPAIYSLWRERELGRGRRP